MKTKSDRPRSVVGVRSSVGTKFGNLAVCVCVVPGSISGEICGLFPTFVFALHGWAPDPPMVGIRSPIGLVVGSCTRHPGVLGLIPKQEEPGKTGAPYVNVLGSSRVPVRDERTHPHRTCLVSHSTCPPLSSSPPTNSFIIGPAVINTHYPYRITRDFCGIQVFLANRVIHTTKEAKKGS